MSVEVEDVAIPLDGDSDERFFIRIHRSASGLLPVVVYLPGLTGDASADGLARSLAERLTAAVVLPETTLDPRQSATLGRGGALLRWLTENGRRRSLDPDNIVMFGEGVGAASARLLIGEGHGPCWPVISSRPIIRPRDASEAPAASQTNGSTAPSELRMEPVVLALEAALIQGKAQGISG